MQSVKRDHCSSQTYLSNSVCYARQHSKLSQHSVLFARVAVASRTLNYKFSSCKVGLTGTECIGYGRVTEQEVSKVAKQSVLKLTVPSLHYMDGLCSVAHHAVV